jgi:hypothetical protein
MATYVPRMYLEYFRRGVLRTFSYELLDEDAGSGDREDNFGLLRNDFSEKPAFGALRNLIEILEDPGPRFPAGSLGYTLSGDTDDLRSLLLQKRDGTFFLALWRATEVWDPRSRSELSSPPRKVDVSFGRLVEGAEVYAPNVSAAPVNTLGAVGARPLSLAIGPEVVILRVDVGARRASTGRIKLWVSRRSVPAGGRIKVLGLLPKQARGRSMRVKIQRRHRRGWRTVSRSRTSRRGVFRKRIRVSARGRRRARLRVVTPAPQARPSRPVQVLIRRR